MRAADLVTATVLLVLGGVVLVDAARLGIGWGTGGPGSGFFPFWLALFLVVVAAVIFVQEARRATGQPFVTREKLRPVLTVLWPAAALVVLTQIVGLYVASALYLAYSMRRIGRYAWSTVVGLAVGVPAVTFLIFERWFLVPMPKGPLENWLGF